MRYQRLLFSASRSSVLAFFCSALVSVCFPPQCACGALFFSCALASFQFPSQRACRHLRISAARLQHLPFYLGPSSLMPQSSSLCPCLIHFSTVSFDMPSQELLSSPTDPPLPAVIRRPQGPPEAVLLLLHGFALAGDAYTALSTSLAAQSILTISPITAYPSSSPAGSPSELASVASWARRVASAFPDAPLVIGGHSRGAQAALMMVLSAAALGAPRVGAVVLLDIVEGVAGSGKCLLREATDWGGLRGIPVLSIGCGLGAEGLFPAAPEGRNFRAVWDEGLSRVGGRFFQVEVEGYGHLDFLDEGGGGVVGRVGGWIVKGGEDRGVFRDFVAQAVTSFCRASLRRGTDEGSGASDVQAEEGWLSSLFLLSEGLFGTGVKIERAGAIFCRGQVRV